MSARYRFTPQANNDLYEIWCYIARDNVDAATQVESSIYEACASLVENPLCGHVRKHVTRLPVRFWTVPRYPNYILVYDPSALPLSIIRVLHGARNLSVLLERKKR